MDDEVLYGEQTRLTLVNMAFSGRQLSGFPEVVKAMAEVKLAAARANRASGRLAAATADRIAEACAELIAGRYLDQFPIDVFHGGGAIGLNMNINEVIATLAGPGVDPIDEVNLSQSTNDACPTAIRLAVYRAVDALIAALDETATELDSCVRRAGELETIARTCWQDGLAVSAGALFSALATALRRQQRHLETSAAELLEVNLGGTVIGSGAGATAGYRQRVVADLAAVTGLPVVLSADLYDASQYPDDLARLSGDIAITSHLVTKFAQDLRWLSSGPECGLGELTLPAVQAGSSFFPGKVNPVIPETIIQCDLLVSGNDTIVQRAISMGEGHLSLWTETMGFLVIDNLRMLTRAITLFARRCLAGVEFNADVCQRYATSTVPTICRMKDAQGYRATTDQIKADGAAQVAQNYLRTMTTGPATAVPAKPEKERIR
jgi:aspartate ammonia-lyase